MATGSRRYASRTKVRLYKGHYKVQRKLSDSAGGFFEEFVDEGLVGLESFGGHTTELAEELRGDTNSDGLFGVSRSGRPTLGARRSSAFVDSGMLEKLSLLSGIGLSPLERRLARADDANDFLGIGHLSMSQENRFVYIR